MNVAHFARRLIEFPPSLPKIVAVLSVVKIRVHPLMPPHPSLTSQRGARVILYLPGSLIQAAVPVVLVSIAMPACATIRCDVHGPHVNGLQRTRSCYV
jgi:hypothetical protein